MEIIRKSVRLSYDDIPEVLQNPLLLFNCKEVGSRIINLSPLGAGLLIDKHSKLDKGDIFYLKYSELDLEIKCICVFSDADGEKRSIGGYFTEADDKKLILKFLHTKNSD